jgi:hypothetical protein
MSYIDTMKDVVTLVQKLDNIDLTNKILELQAAALEEQEETSRLLARVEELERARDVSERLTFEDKRYWLDAEDEDRDGPFCSRCWDVDRKLVRLHLTGGVTKCPQRSCGTKFRG